MVVHTLAPVQHHRAARTATNPLKCMQHGAPWMLMFPRAFLHLPTCHVTRASSRFTCEFDPPLAVHVCERKRATLRRFTHAQLDGRAHEHAAEPCAMKGQ